MFYRWRTEAGREKSIWLPNQEPHGLSYCFSARTLPPHVPIPTHCNPRRSLSRVILSLPQEASRTVGQIRETEARAGEGAEGSEPRLGLSCPVRGHFLGSGGPHSQHGVDTTGTQMHEAPHVPCGVHTNRRQAGRGGAQQPRLASQVLPLFLWPLPCPLLCPLPPTGCAVCGQGPGQSRAGPQQ